MRCTTISGLAVSCLALAGMQSRCAAQNPIPFPTKADGYEITKTDKEQPAPAGYEGTSDIATETAVGNTPATAGKRVKATFTLSNQIRTCPLADGTAEGTGLFSASIDFTDQKANETNKVHVEMSTKAKYKGQVGDDALLQGQVNANIDYTYSQTGGTHDRNGAILSNPQPHFEQHVTIPVVVLPGMKSPEFGPFSGGNPAEGHYAQAIGAGMALAYWGAVYYSIAELKWYGGDSSHVGRAVSGGVCAQVAFDPPSNTLQPPLGTNASVNAVVKTKNGETVPGRLAQVDSYYGSMVTATTSQSNENSPMHFIYTAPGKKVKEAGFKIVVLSRAGTAQAQWDTGLGTGWSGQITYSNTFTRDYGHNDLQDWSSSAAANVTVDVKDGVARVSGHAEHKYEAESRHPVAVGGGKVTLVKERSDSMEGSGDGTFPAKVTVSIDETHRTYAITIDPQTGRSGRPTTWGVVGKEHWTRCYRSDCQSGDQDIGLPLIAPAGPLGGNPQDLNHIHASYTEKKEGLGRSKNAEMIQTTTVNLARSGHTNPSSASK